MLSWTVLVKTSPSTLGSHSEQTRQTWVEATGWCRIKVASSCHWRAAHVSKNLSDIILTCNIILTCLHGDNFTWILQAVSAGGSKVCLKMPHMPGCQRVFRPLQCHSGWPAKEATWKSHLVYHPQPEHYSNRFPASRASNCYSCCYNNADKRRPILHKHL